MSHKINEIMNISTLYHMLACNVNAWRTGKEAYWAKCKPGLDNMYAQRQASQTRSFDKEADKPIEVIHMVTQSPNITGLSDQLRASLSLYQMCKREGICFKIFWDYPFNLNEFLQPNDYDWVISHDEINYHYPTRYRAVYCEKGIAMQRCLDKRLFYSILSTLGGGQFHIFTNSWFNSRGFSKTFDELFKPSPLLQQEVGRHRAMLGHRYFSVSFRFMELLGDFDDSGLATPLPDQEREAIIERCVSQLKKIIRKYPSDYKAFVCSDSSSFLERVKDLPQVYVVPGRIVHLQFQSSKEVYLKTFVDMLLLRGAEKRYLIKTGGMYNSGFPKFASLIGNRKFKLIKV